MLFSESMSPVCLCTRTPQEFLTHRYQMNVNSIPVTIVQTNNRTTQFALLSNLNPSTAYDIVRFFVTSAMSMWAPLDRM